MRNKDQILLESIYEKIKEQYDAPQPVPPAQISKEKSSMEKMGENIFRAAYTGTLKQRGYTDEQIKKYWEEFDKQKQNKKTSSGGIDFQNPEIQNKIKQAYKQKGYTDEELKILDSMFKPEKINSLKSSMLANGIDFNKILQESFKDSIMTGDKGIKRSVEAVVKFAEENKNKYFQKSFPIGKLEHELKWWDDQNKKDPEKSNTRMMMADTSYPLLVIKNKSYGLSVSDGLNRLKKAKDIEGKKNIDVYIVPEEDIPDTTIVK